MLDFWMPEAASSFAGRIDSLFLLILVITGVVFVVVELLLLVFVVRYRHRDGRRAEYSHGNRNYEIAWTAGTAVIVLMLAFLSRGLWLELKEPSRFPAPGFEVHVAAKQFEWNTTYAGPDGVFGTEDDFVVRNQLHVPVGTVVHVHLTAEDVIHSFFVPEFRVKQDAVPGMEIPTWFEATRTGEFAIGCAELCGLGHYRMRGTLIVHDADGFRAWQDEQFAAARGEARAVAHSDDDGAVHTALADEPR
jgi:cytochrome c oxidase subunit II